MSRAKVVAIVQARMGSTRLPGKTMAEICGKPLLQHLLERLQRARSLDAIVVATTERAEDDVIADFARAFGVGVFRGSSEDVLDRFVKAAEAWEAQVVVRICADSPLTDPAQVDRAVESHLAQQPDYTYNHLPACGLPDGTGAEVISIEALRRVSRVATSPQHREHVTKYILDNPKEFRVQMVMAEPDVSRPDLRVDVDTPQDLALLREIHQALYRPDRPLDIKDVIVWMDKQRAKT
ncbi:MAG: glycosyltransferase family protein [Dehalococcoidia bacterium]|nr:glycosyltransferase family protein [Dehalococcoidia bacterium]